MVEMSKIEAFVRRLVDEYEPEKVILFGSYAYGDPRDGSDVDLLVVMNTSDPPAMKAVEMLRSLRPRFSIDLIVRTPEQVVQRLAWDDFFLQDIFEKGKVLHESAHVRVD
ncbi:MAG: nucleotidyltransferase domain-containing protein [Candidatus Hydrogenedentes bacterium]|nr:nucleotidyltransferase domain-containing protein [Candidatus Hydrogenedentota bacterium]